MDFYFFLKYFAQGLSGEQKQTEELTTDTLHKILFILYSFSSPNTDTVTEIEVETQPLK